MPAALIDVRYRGKADIARSYVVGRDLCCAALVGLWHLTDVHADRYFGRYRGKNGHTASTREPTRLTLSGRKPGRNFATQQTPDLSLANPVGSR